MKKYIVFEHRVECKRGASVSEMETVLVDEDDEILIQGDTDFCELRKCPDVTSCHC